MTLIFQHDAGCRYARESDGGHSDASRRVADEYNLHRVAGGEATIGRWISCALSDGRSDHTLYDSKADAELHQHGNETRYLYLPIKAMSMSVCSAATLLRTARMLYDLANHQTGDRVVIPRLTNEHQARQLERFQQLVNRR
jgi:hypothetical protein